MDEKESYSKAGTEILELLKLWSIQERDIQASVCASMTILMGNVAIATHSNSKALLHFISETLLGSMSLLDAFEEDLKEKQKPKEK